MRVHLAFPLLLGCLASAAAAQSDEPAAQLAQADDAVRRPSEEARYRADREPILLVVEGLAEVVSVEALRERLAALFGRPVVGLANREAGATLATLWVSAEEQELVVRLSGFERADLWQRVARDSLGADPASGIANVVLEMLFSERVEQSRSSEMLDPFCARGSCRDEARARRSRRRPVDPSVLDPWDAAYPRFAPLDPVTEPPRYHDRDDPFAAEVAPASSAPPPRSQARLVAGPAQAAEKGAAGSPWALDLLAGAGVYEPGGFVRYQVDVLRRFERFDVGFAFVGARGQPDARHYVRRAMVAMLQRRFVMDGLEVDLGASLGVLTSDRPQQTLEARPYLRGVTAFSIALAGTFDLLLQSEIGTTFADVDGTGVIDYALAIGPRIGL